MNTALLIIDVQNALCSGEEECFDSQRIIRTINELAAKTRALGLTVILIQHEELEGSLTYGSAAWQLADDLLTAADDLRVRKTTPDAFYQTDLQPLLQARGHRPPGGLRVANRLLRQRYRAPSPCPGVRRGFGGRCPLHGGQRQHGG